MADARGGPDLEVRFRTDRTAGDLVAAWPAGGTGHLVVDGRAWPDDRPLLACGLADGAVVTVGEAIPRHDELVVVAGPLAPSRATLGDRVLVGRGRCCDLRLDHDAVAPAHALVERADDGWTVCRVDGLVEVDGVEIGGPTPLDVGSVLSVGPIDLQVLLDEPPLIVPPPRAPAHRPARPPDAEPEDPGPPPAAPPTVAPPTPPGALTVLAPVAIGVVLAITVHPTAGLVTATMPLFAIGAHLDARRRHRRDQRRAAARHTEALAAHRAHVHGIELARATQARSHCPSPVDALRRARRGDLGAGEIAVGWSPRHAPVTTTADVIGVAGPAPWAAAVARVLPGEVEVADRLAGLTDRCEALVLWALDGARFSDHRTGRRDVPVRPFVADERLAIDTARALARWHDPGEHGLPAEVRLTDLAPPAAEDGRRRLACPLGVGHDGPVEVDLVRDGPHALVAGTTGAGKSELLRTWVTGLARRHPPTAVAFVLVDYKGGTAFDACAALPHVTGVVTDLDPGLGERLLVALRAEVREREAALRVAGVGDLRDLDGGPPRLVVVVDEFATLAAELPDFLSALVDVARRGRSLGLHLVLATQRPAGAVNDDIRANTALRLCLRTLDAADSQDVLGTPAAACLPGDRSGRAWLRRDGAPELLQVATTGLPTPMPLEVRRLDEPRRDGPGELADVVAAIDAAWGDGPRPAPTWLPPLPEVLDLPDGLGRIDQPADRRQPLLTWTPEDGHLLVVGGRRSGRTSALLAAVARVPDVHHVYAIDGGTGLAPLAALPHTGAVLRADDRASVRRLFGRLATVDAPTLLVVDGLDQLGDELHRFEALDRSITIVAGTTRPIGLPAALRTAMRLTLRLDDPADYALAGIRPPGRPLPPGRGWTADGDEVQLVAPGPVSPQWDPPRPGHEPARITPLPAFVRSEDLDAPGLVLGLRDRDLRPAVLCLPAGPFVVSGPPRSGRSAALDLLAAQLDLPCSRDPSDIADWLAHPTPHAFVLDDADRWADDRALRELVNGRHPDAIVVLAVRTDAWRSAYGSWLADLRPAGDGLALRPDPARDAELWTVGLPSVGPDAPPGRGVLLSDGRAEILQVARR